MKKIQNKLALGLFAGLVGELAILLSNRVFVKLGLAQSTLNSMSLQVVKCKKWKPLTTKRDKWLSRGISTFFCTSGGLLITYLLSSTNHLRLVKGFGLGMLGGFIPFMFKQLKLIKDFKKTMSKVMCLLSHGLFGLTVAIIGKSFGDPNSDEKLA